MLSRHEVAAQGGADRSSGKGMGESDAILCHGINARSLDVGVSHVPQLVIGELVRHDVDDIRELGGSRDGEAEAGEEGEGCSHSSF